MKKIEEYELHKHGWVLLFGILTIWSPGICLLISNKIIVYIIVFICSVLYIFIASCISAFYDKKIEQYKKEHASDLSLDSSQL